MPIKKVRESNNPMFAYFDICLVVVAVNCIVSHRLRKTCPELFMQPPSLMNHDITNLGTPITDLLTVSLLILEGLYDLLTHMHIIL